ncbi:Protein of unknown function [Mucilaginibacter lappiensis]|uniref:Capsular polysaccharide biosynthesis protein n=1 Tax=Mucilaginibacter lappiensis TaxID=354630 RepID=A0ABR6PSX2_9SPHI|nr:glycosyltransferase family 61 protein [Mucilaginibacter lappiensis]MBB6112886.1 capsular polysaccharide biosynthesis protein [Mucilaginibacter lappiensis]SIS08886.1 Protein of unknown function [Mucilaginibacter lappiensis]
MRQNIVTVLPPVNMIKEDEGLFLPFLTYRLAPLKVRRLNNAFVTHSGFCLTNKGLAKECYHDYPGQLSDYLKEASGYYENALVNPQQLIELDDEQTYLLIHHPWFMYYHWICESLFRLWMVKEQLDSLILLLPEKYQGSEYVRASLEPFALKKIFFIPDQKSVLLNSLCVPQIKTKMEGYDRVALKEVSSFYRRHVSDKKRLNTNFGERIYVSRRKAGRRHVINEEEVVDIMKKYDFIVLCNEDHGFFEQVAIHAHARYLVSIHGSGLTNMLFMPEGSSILEFHKQQTTSYDWHSQIFWYMADALGHRYFHQICPPEDPAADIFVGNLIVDTVLLEQNLLQMLDGKLI